MTLIKTSLMNSIAVIIRMLTLFSINKILAIYVGPSGYASLGQFQNAAQMITAFASGAINLGVTKYTAEHFNDEDSQHTIWRTSGTITLIGSLATAAVIIAFNKQLAAFILKDSNYSGVFIWFAGTLTLFTFNSLLMAVLNGKKEIKRYVSANIAGSIFALILTTYMSVKFGLYGALVALAIYQSTSFFITFYICTKTSWFKAKHFFGRIDKTAAMNLMKYTAMALASATFIPASHILVRNYLGKEIGWAAAGYWEAMWRLSSAYLMMITTALSVYFLPRFSEIKDPLELRREISQGFKVIFPFVAASSLIIFLFRDVIISLLFTKEFIPMKELFGWQLVGDALKVCSWILGYVIIARAYFKFFILMELIYSVMFLTLVIFIVKRVGLQGAAFAHAICYFFHFLMLLIYLRLKKHIL